jgi:lysophospholipase L1-like esterase
MEGREEPTRALDEERAAPPRRKASRLALAASSTVAALLLGEVVARAFVDPPVEVEITVGGPLPGAYETEEKVFQRQRRVQGLFQLTPTGRRLRPNTTVQVEKHTISGLAVEVRTNSLGLRNRELGPKNGRRILFLGDSITLADYLPEEQCFVRQVETLARAKGLEWEAVNAGVSGASLKSELALLVETGLSVQPDVVVLAWYLNDYQDSPGVQVNAHGFWSSQSRLVYGLGRLLKTRAEVARANEPMRAWWPRWSAEVMPGLIGGDERRGGFYLEVGSAFSDWGAAWSDEAWAVMEPLLVELVRRTRAAGARPAWLALPTQQQVAADFDTAQPQERLARIAAEQGVPLLDLLPVLRELQGKSTDPIFYDQCHHSPDASRYLAERILAWLEGV